jgi:hypothetical protein
MYIPVKREEAVIIESPDTVRASRLEPAKVAFISFGPNSQAKPYSTHRYSIWSLLITDMYFANTRMTRAFWSSSPTSPNSYRQRRNATNVFS